MNLPRDDISDYLIHFTKPTEGHEKPEYSAMEVFVKIVKEKRLLGGSGMIKGSYTCICFTESPVAKLPHVFSRREEYGVRYCPYGIMFSKKFLYAEGTRPVIYGPDVDFSELPERFKYRHVRYEPNHSPPIDHSWEREWRLHKRELLFEPDNVTLIVPKRKMADIIRKKKEPWHCLVLEDLGIKT